MKKIVILAPALALTAIASTGCMQQPKSPDPFTIEWLELTPQNWQGLQPTIDALEPVYVEAYLPILKADNCAHDPRLANIPNDKKATVEATVEARIIQTLHDGFNKKISSILDELNNKNLEAAFLAIAQDSKHQILGFALFSDKPLTKSLNKPALALIQQSLNKAILQATPHSQIMVEMLMVKPNTQKKGVGKQLLFSILDHYPNATTLYLSTLQDVINSNAQKFYEHVGFHELIKGSCNKNMILYVYQKAN